MSILQFARSVTATVLKSSSSVSRVNTSFASNVSTDNMPIIARTVSQAFLGRTVFTASRTAVRVCAPLASRSNAAITQFSRSTQQALTFGAPATKAIDFSRGFQCSAMSYEDEAAPEAAPVVPAENSKLYVGNLSWNVASDELRSIFEVHGAIQSCQVVMDPNGRSRGFAFVEFASVAEASAAADSLNSQELDGREMRVNFHQPRDPNAPRPQRREAFDDNCRIYVGNLPWSFDDFDLQDTFSEFGDVVNARVIIDRETGRSRGFGFVTMKEEDSVDKAIGELDGSVCDGRNIRVNKAGQR